MIQRHTLYIFHSSTWNLITILYILRRTRYLSLNLSSPKLRILPFLGDLRRSGIALSLSFWCISTFVRHWSTVVSALWRLCFSALSEYGCIYRFGGKSHGAVICWQNSLIICVSFVLSLINNIYFILWVVFRSLGDFWVF